MSGKLILVSPPPGQPASGERAPIVCPVCSGAGGRQVERPSLIRPGHTIMRWEECECVIEKRRRGQSRLERQRRVREVRAQLQQIPPRFARARLVGLRADSDRHEHQAEVIAHVQRQPDASYLFTGANGTGKTHFAYALARQAAIGGRRLIACKLSELLGEYRDQALDAQADEPRVRPDDLRQSKAKYTLLLDEIEKVRPTPFAVEMFFALVDAAYHYSHQLLATSNFTVKQLVSHWGKLDPTFGKSIMRRYVETCSVIEMA